MNHRFAQFGGTNHDSTHYKWCLRLVHSLRKRKNNDKLTNVVLVSEDGNSETGELSIEGRVKFKSTSCLQLAL